MDIQDYFNSFKYNSSVIIPHDCYLKSWKLRLTWETGILNSPSANALISPLHRINASLQKNQMNNDPHANYSSISEGFFQNFTNRCNLTINTIMGQNGITGFMVPSNVQRAAGYYEELTHTFTEPVFLNKNSWLDVRLWRNEGYSLIEGSSDQLIPKVNFEFDLA